MLEGRYRVLERLARGGMSTVYSALDERLDRLVAVKVMSAALSTDPAFVDRFAREARVAARLSHLNAVAVYDQGSDGGHVFLVMELVRGRTLRDLIRERGVLSPAQAVSIMEPVLAALAAAHRAGLVHRDVKPENILLSDDGAVKVADFGLARAIEADASSTRTGLMMGTVAYCPPEQISRGAADARSDVYSAGVVLFELLTGAAPYVGDSAMAVAYQHVNSDVPPPSSRRPGIPPQLDEIVLRATSREPSGRPLDAGALLAELHDARMDLGLPVIAVPPRPLPVEAADTQQIARGTASQGRPAAAHHAAGRPPPAPPILPFGPAPGQRAGSAGAGGPGGAGAGIGSAEATTAPTAGVRYAPDPLQHTAVHPREPVERPRQDRPPVAEQGRLHAHQPAGPSQRRRRARRRTFIVVLIIVLLGLLTGYGAWYVAVGRYHQVPNLIGQSQSVATRQLRTAGFQVAAAVDQQFSENAPTGAVIGTHPGAGSHLLGGKAVQLVLSKGAERFTVPAVAGQSYAQAQQAFAAMPLRLKRADTADPTGNIAPGQVIKTDPAPAAKVKRDAVITVYVSTGPPIIAVPDVSGQSQNDANSTLVGAGFKVALSQDYSDKVPAGSVISQDPAGKASVAKFSTVNLVISKGAPVVTIPGVHVGESVSDATATLEAAGLQVRTRKLADAVIFHEVWSVSPKSGDTVPKGSTVTLTIF